jgi:hypothetical protein
MSNEIGIPIYNNENPEAWRTTAGELWHAGDLILKDNDFRIAEVVAANRKQGGLGSWSFAELKGPYTLRTAWMLYSMAIECELKSMLVHEAGEWRSEFKTHDLDELAELVETRLSIKFEAVEMQLMEMLPVFTFWGRYPDPDPKRARFNGLENNLTERKAAMYAFSQESQRCIYNLKAKDTETLRTLRAKFADWAQGTLSS